MDLIETNLEDLIMRIPFPLVKKENIAVQTVVYFNTKTSQFFALCILSAYQVALNTNFRPFYVLSRLQYFFDILTETDFLFVKKRLQHVAYAQSTIILLTYQQTIKLLAPGDAAKVYAQEGYTKIESKMKFLCLKRLFILTQRIICRQKKCW